jgi:E1A/CREB-binding protein
MNVGQAAHLSGQMSGQTAQMNQVPGTGVGVGVGVGVGGADGLPQHQPMQEMAALSGTDQQFVMLRTAMREKMYVFIYYC